MTQRIDNTDGAIAGMPGDGDIGAAGARAPGAGGKPVSLRDVAKLANVSVATVSMVLNDNPRISRATHNRVQRLIDRLGYRPNRLAQSLSSRYTNVLAIVLPALRHAFADAYFGELISGICDRAQKLGQKVMLEQAKPEFVKDKRHIELYERRFVDGILCLGMNGRHYFLNELAEGSYPAIVVDNYFPQWKNDYVACDYEGGAQQVMTYLLQLGHRNIGFIAGALDVTTARRVRDIYLARAREAGGAVDDSWIADGKFTEEGGAQAALELLERHPEMTAIFAGNDKMAIGALHQLNRHGVDVPRQMSVVGFDNMQHSAFVTPSLTTVNLPLYQVGGLACERLVERIHGRIGRVGESLATHLVIRQSTAMVRGEGPLTLAHPD